MNKFCINCGHELNSEDRFCVNCGKEINAETKLKKEEIKNNETKSKVVAGVLGILVGSIGVHNFYLGYNNKAIAQLLITVLSCGALSVVSGIWGLIEGIQILTGTIKFDAQGNPLGE